MQCNDVMMLMIMLTMMMMHEGAVCGLRRSRCVHWLAMVLIIIARVQDGAGFVYPFSSSSLSFNLHHHRHHQSQALSAGLSWRADEIYHSQPDFPVLFLATRNQTYAREVEGHFGK